MENETKEQQELDIFILLEDFLRHAKRTWALGMVLILLCGIGMTFMQRRSYRESYEAYASFTVRVSNPLYASVSGYKQPRSWRIPSLPS